MIPCAAKGVAATMREACVQSSTYIFKPPPAPSHPPHLTTPHHNQPLLDAITSFTSTSHISSYKLPTCYLQWPFFPPCASQKPFRRLISTLKPRLNLPKIRSYTTLRTLWLRRSHSINLFPTFHPPLVPVYTQALRNSTDTVVSTQVAVLGKPRQTAGKSIFGCVRTAAMGQSGSGRVAVHRAVMPSAAHVLLKRSKVGGEPIMGGRTPPLVQSRASDSLVLLTSFETCSHFFSLITTTVSIVFAVCFGLYFSFVTFVSGVLVGFGLGSCLPRYLSGWVHFVKAS
jgi:hypothetical protein